MIDRYPYIFIRRGFDPQIAFVFVYVTRVYRTPLVSNRIIIYSNNNVPLTGKSLLHIRRTNRGYYEIIGV